MILQSLIINFVICNIVIIYVYYQIGKWYILSLSIKNNNYITIIKYNYDINI